jgi:preprotein translocase subunit SecG
MMTFITVVHISTVVLLVIAVLLQSGKGAEISASFGGSSQTVFGSSGGQNFFQKLTYGLAAVFMLTSLVLTILPGKTKKSVFEGYTPTTTPVSAPTTTGTAPTTTTEPAKTAEPVKAAAPSTTAPAAEQKK